MSLSRRIHALTGTIAILVVGVGLVVAGVGASTASAASGEITEYQYPEAPFGGASEGQIAAGPEGDLWFAGVGGPVIWGGVGRFSPPGEWLDVAAEEPSMDTNAFVGNGTNGIAVGPDGNLWFTAGRGIGRIKPSGTPPEAEDFFLPPVEKAAKKEEPLPGTSLGGITAGPEHENLWFTDVEAPNTNKIGRINATSHLMTEFPLPVGNELGTGVGGLGNDDIAVGHEGNLWFTEPASHAVGVINTKGEFQHQFFVATSPLGIAAGPNGDMWFTDGTTPDVIGRITPSGEVTEFPSPGASSSIVEGPDGNMWFTTGGHGTGEAGLGCITPTGQTALHPDPTPSGLPWGIAVSKDGSIWFTELSANRLGRLYPVVCGATPEVAPTPTPTPTPIPPTPNSGYTVESIVGNSNGTVSITFVPTQSGEATLVVTVPTASIASTSATAAKAKKCKHGQVKIKGRCLPSTTVTGKASGSGTAGVPLKLTVNLSSKIKALLKKGKTVHLTATLTYKSALGGASTVNTYQVTVKGHKPKKKKK